MTPGFHSDGFIIGICCAGRDVRREGGRKGEGKHGLPSCVMSETQLRNIYISVTRNDSSTITILGKEQIPRNPSQLGKAK